MTKPKVGFYSVTGCQGCLLSVIFQEDELPGLIEKLDIKSFPFIKEKVSDEHLDIVFFEGVIASPHDEELVKKIRDQCDVFVALGACATTGGVPALRNFTPEENIKPLIYHKAVQIADFDPTPVDKFVKVDYYIQGCPPDKKEILGFINDLLLGKKPLMYSKPVCVECRKNKNPCLLQEGLPCLGPITNGGCNSVCTNGGLACWGCRGPAQDSSFDLMIRVLKDKGYDEKFIKQRIDAFEGLKRKEKEDKKKWLE